MTAANRSGPPDLDRQLMGWLDSQTGDRNAWTITLVEARKFASSRERKVFRADHAGSGRTVAIKTNSAAWSNRAEFRALDGMHRQMPDSVEPLHITRSGRYYAMSWIDAPLLTERVEHGDRHGALVLAGAWLARLQRRSATAEPTGRRIGFPRLPVLPGRGVVREATRRLRARLRRMARGSGTPVMLHGDYQPGNLFDFGDRTVVFDRVADIWGIPHLDSAKFLTGLASRRVRAAERGHGWNGDSESDRRSFFEGYGPLPEPELKRFDLIEDLVLYRKWRHYRSHDRDQDRLDDEMRQRGLLGDEGTLPRPGRLLAGAGGAGIWTREPAAG